MFRACFACSSEIVCKLVLSHTCSVYRLSLGLESEHCFGHSRVDVLAVGMDLDRSWFSTWLGLLVGRALATKEFNTQDGGNSGGIVV